jgi:Short C-terminal domain
MPGLLRGVARTAVVAGTATAVSGRVARRQAGRWAAKDQQQYEAEQYEEQQSAVPAQAVYAEPPSVAPADDMNAKLAQLAQLGELKTSGVLTDAEFETQKSRILNS